MRGGATGRRDRRETDGENRRRRPIQDRPSTRQRWHRGHPARAVRIRVHREGRGCLRGPVGGPPDDSTRSVDHHGDSSLHPPARRSRRACRPRRPDPVAARSRRPISGAGIPGSNPVRRRRPPPHRVIQRFRHLHAGPSRGIRASGIAGERRRSPLIRPNPRGSSQPAPPPDRC